jgi:hypothetical protein
MFVGAETVAGTGFDAAQARLVRLARGGWLAGASGQAFGELDQGLARVGPAPGVSRLVEVHVCELVTRGRAVLALRWEAAGPGGGLFPVLDADITMAPYGESGTLIALAGSYRPPLGLVGAALDRVVLHRVAAATVRRFVNRIGEAVADPAVAPVAAVAAARATGSGERGVWRFPVAPQEG